MNEPSKRIAILGNSGSGKSWLAKELARQTEAPILDLDTIFFEPGKIAVPRPSATVLADLERFCVNHEAWIIEGCYGDIVAHALRWEPELILLDPGESECLRHCRARPWEPHKYASKTEQDSKLDFLLAWVSEYYRREGPMSLSGHRALFDAYSGPKRLMGR